MRVIVDTNILLSALISPHGLPAQLIDAWRGARYELAEASGADYLVTDDKRDVLVLKAHERTRIVTARQLLDVLNP